MRERNTLDQQRRLSFRLISHIMLRLCVPELEVFAALFLEQLFVAAELDEPAAVEHRDLVAEATNMS